MHYRQAPVCLSRKGSDPALAVQSACGPLPRMVRTGVIEVIVQAGAGAPAVIAQASRAALRPQRLAALGRRAFSRAATPRTTNHTVGGACARWLLHVRWARNLLLLAPQLALTIIKALQRRGVASRTRGATRKYGGHLEENIVRQRSRLIILGAHQCWLCASTPWAFDAGGLQVRVRCLAMPVMSATGGDSGLSRLCRSVRTHFG
jgi:hypothetical protein